MLAEAYNWQMYLPVLYVLPVSIGTELVMQYHLHI